MTWRQSGIYKDAETLYRETLRRNPSSWLAHNNLGFLLSLKSGGLPEARGARSLCAPTPSRVSRFGSPIRKRPAEKF
jgi:hypothetical protein